VVADAAATTDDDTPRNGAEILDLLVVGAGQADSRPGTRCTMSWSPTYPRATPRTSPSRSAPRARVNNVRWDDGRYTVTVAPGNQVRTRALIAASGGLRRPCQLAQDAPAPATCRTIRVPAPA
jgi:hypothetical protein